MTAASLLHTDNPPKEEHKISPQQRIAELSRAKGETLHILRSIASTLEEVVPGAAVIIEHIGRDRETLVTAFLSSRWGDLSHEPQDVLVGPKTLHSYCIKHGEDLIIPDIPSFLKGKGLHALIHAFPRRSAIIRRVRPTNGGCWGCVGLYFGSAGHVTEETLDAVLRQRDTWIQLAVTIIERRLLEESLRTAQIRFELASSASGIGIFDWNVSSNEIFWTPQTLAIVGIHPEPATMSYEDWRQRAHPDDIPAVERQFIRAFCAQAQSIQTTWRIIRPTGELRWIESIGEIIYSDDGKPLRVIGTVQDTTDQMRAKEQVFNDRRRLELALEAGELGFWDWHIPSGSVQFGGQWATMLGLAPNDVEPSVLGWQRLVHPDDMPIIADVLSKHLQGLTPFYETEYRLRTKDNNWIWVLDRGRVVERDATGAALRAIGIRSNITHKRAVQEALREADKRKDEFLATLAHELRNPLAPIRTGLAIIKKNPSGSGAFKAREMMERQLSHMVRLVDDLLDVSRITSGRLALKKELVSAQMIIDTAIEASRPYIDAAHHRLEVEALAEDIYIFCDPTRVAQTISNILNNAAKYTPDGGQIHLAARVTEQLLEVSVRDNGLGIPADMLEHVFDLFGQVNRTLDRSQGGLGIGLALVKTLVQLHGGEVTVESEGIGKGSIFTIRLPLDALDVKISSGSLVETTGRRMNEKRVLIVDDNVDGATSLSMFTELLGHKTEVAHSGPEALEKVQSFRPDVVFLDIGLPGMSGFEVAKIIRCTPQALNVRLVALTGWSSEETKRQATDSGFNDHLTKPVDLSEIENILSS